MDDFRKILYGVLIGFVLMLVVWISLLTSLGCGFSLSCAAAIPTAQRTSIPTLVPATLPAPTRLFGAATGAAGASGTSAPSGTQGAVANETQEPAEEAARPSNPGGPGPALSLTGDPAAGQQLFSANCAVCHGANGKGGNPNPGSEDGTIPALNPIDPTIANADPKIFAMNADLFLEHGSTPGGPNPTFSMPAWGDKKLLTPQQIADAIAYVISLNPQASAGQPNATAAATSTKSTASAAGNATPTANETTEPAEEAKPSNPGGPGPAIGLTGDPVSGQQIFASNCQICHGTEGKGGNPNPGSNDGTIPALNPIDATIKNPDPKVFATNMDLFIEHGSTPAGPNPTFSMIAWGDKQLLTPQQIADVMAYVMSLNK